MLIEQTINCNGAIKEFVRIHIKIQKHKELIDLAITNLGNTDLYLGYKWLIHHNPTVDWVRKTITFENCPDTCGYKLHVVIDNPVDTLTLEEGDQLLMMGDEIYINYVQMPMQNTFDIPNYTKEFPNVFSEKEFQALPPCCLWDHAIDLTLGSKPVNCPLYPLSQPEKEALSQFIEEHLKSGCI